MPARPETPEEYRRRGTYAVALESVEAADTVLDRVVNWLAEHPRLTCAVICAVAVIPLFVEVPR
jgi:hypothetical protein